MTDAVLAGDAIFNHLKTVSSYLVGDQRHRRSFDPVLTLC